MMGATNPRTTTSAAWLFACALPLLFTAACGAADSANQASRVAGGRVHAGASAIDRYRCGACHTIPGIRDARGLVAPPLNRFAKRSFIAGRIPNTADNLMRWIVNPRAVDSMTAMPVLGVTAQDARDIAAYLYTLQ